MEQTVAAAVQGVCVGGKKDKVKTVLVELLLLRSHVHTQDLLHLGGKRLLHIFLDASQQEGLKDFVETLITIIPSFPVFILKILPRIKPAVHKRYQTRLVPGWF